jgi:D-alanine-D-alanine ligase-like ATP-grasp enzyme
MNRHKKQALVMFGGESAEHDVSIISGLQVVEKIDRSTFDVHVVYITKDGEMQYVKNLKSRKDFLSAKRSACSFGKDMSGGYMAVQSVWGSKKVRLYAAYLAFHGGSRATAHRLWCRRGGIGYE